MRDPLRERVATFLRTNALLRPDALLVVAVSGGPDSLCLLHLLTHLREAGGPALHVAHLDHGARGDQSRGEAAHVAALAAAWGLPATVDQRDVPALAAARREGLQAAARHARYAFLAETALAVGAHAVAVAHQADDQAETVLLHALRGAGPAGLRGMRAVVPWAEWGGGDRVKQGDKEAAAGVAQAPDGMSRGLQVSLSPFLIRPLLATPHADIEVYCAAHGLEPARDPSNASPRYARTRVRRLLPALAAENPRLVEALGRTARVCADDYDFIQGQLEAIWPDLASEGPGAVALRREAWAGLHPALQRYALRRAAATLGQAELSLELVEDARALAAKSGRSMRLGPRLRLTADQLALTLTSDVAQTVQLSRLVSPLPRTGEGEGVRAVPQLAVDELALAVPGTTALGGGWACIVGEKTPAEPGPWWVELDAAALDGPLVLRRRRAGDSFLPAGGRGGRKLQDFFVDRKVPREQRDAWPILATPGEVVWVTGLRADARFVAGGATHSTIWVGLVHNKEQTDAP